MSYRTKMIFCLITALVMSTLGALFVVTARGPRICGEATRWRALPALNKHLTEDERRALDGGMIVEARRSRFGLEVSKTLPISGGKTVLQLRLKEVNEFISKDATDSILTFEMEGSQEKLLFICAEDSNMLVNVSEGVFGPETRMAFAPVKE